MITWTQDPGDNTPRNKWHVHRVAKGGQVKGIFIATAHVGVWTHFVSNRTQPCRAPECEGCEAKQRREWHAYIPIWQPGGDTRCMLELTARAAEPLIAHVAAGKSLRGWTFRAWRTGPKNNSPVDVQIFADESEKYQLPTAPDIVECLLRTWRLHDDPSARIAAPEATFVRGHVRKKEKANGTSQARVDGPARTEQPGRPGSSNGVHIGNGKTDYFPTSSSSEPTID